MLSNASFEALGVSGAFKKVDVPSVIGIQNVILGSGQAGYLTIRVAVLFTTRLMQEMIRHACIFLRI